MNDMSSIGLSTPAQRLEAELDGARSWIAAFRFRNGTIKLQDGTDRLQTLKTSANAELDALRDKLAAEPDPAKQTDLAIEGARQAWRIVGRYRELADRLDRQPFTVEPDRRGGQVVDLTIKARDAAIPTEAGKLKTEIDSAMNIVTTVFADRLSWKPWLHGSQAWEQRVEAARSDYVLQLVGVAEVGLCTTEPSRIAFARLDLTRVTSLFTLREAGVIKNQYVGRLFFWSALASLLFFVLYALVRLKVGCLTLGEPACTILYDTRNFHLLAVGTAVGTWLSFSLRRQDLVFADLAALEPDRLNPAARIVFMMGLATLVGLLLFTGAVVAGIGNVDGVSGTHEHGSYALLFGLLAGVAERALGAAVSARGRDFASVIGGGAPPPAPGTPT